MTQSGKSEISSDLQAARFSPRPATTWQFLWLCGLILSFCYELPLATLFQFDRLNPRLFDLMMALGVVTVLPGCVNRAALPPAFKAWTNLVVVFVVCAAIWFPFLPSDVGKFSLWFAFKYGLSLLCLYMVVNIPLTSTQKKLLLKLTVVGGVIVAVYALGEFRAGGYIRTLPDGSVLTKEEGVLWSCLGPTYFHVAIYGCISFAMALALANGSPSIAASVLWSLLAAVVVLPSLFCGSRAGLLCPAVITVAALWLMPRIRVVIALAILAMFLFEGYSTLKHSKTFERLERMEEEQRNTFEQRLTLKGYSVDNYDQLRKTLIPVMGGGFYVVPMQTEGELFYRIGYGIHNCYLFVLEQGGVVAVYFFIVFIWKIAKGLRMRLRSPSGGDQAMASGAAAYLPGLMTVALGGQVFWLMDGTVNLMYYQLVLIMLAINPCVPDAVRGFRPKRRRHRAGLMS